MMIKQSGNVAKSFLKKETLLLSLITFLGYLQTKVGIPSF